MLQHCHILGIPQCVAETTNLAMCSVELKQILHSIIRPHNVMSTQQVIELMSLGALRNCKLIQLNGSAARQANEIANPLSDPNLSNLTKLFTNFSIFINFSLCYKTCLFPTEPYVTHTATI